MTFHVTSHAISRYRERVAAVSLEEAEAALSSPAIQKAADFGAPFVKLGTGQRVVLIGHRVVTVLPAASARGKLAPERDWMHGRIQIHHD